MDLKLLEQVTQAFGPSGYEQEIRDLIYQEVKSYADEIQVNPLGTLVAYRAAKQEQDQPQRLMLAAHMDEIGLMVTHVEEKGFLRFTSVGGVRPFNRIGGRARFQDGTIGVVYVERREDTRTTPELRHLYLDVGAESRETCPFKVGDIASFFGPLVKQGSRLTSKAMDDRIGCAVVIQALMEMKESPNDVYFVFTAQEELGTRGAVVSAFGVEPEVGIAVDVTHIGDTPEARPMAVSLGKGPAIKVMDAGMVVNPAVKQWMIDVAEKEGIPYQLEVLEFGGTDARSIQLSKAGVPAGCLSIPCRYVHSPSEMVDYEDVQGAVKLLRKLLESSPSFSS